MPQERKHGARKPGPRRGDGGRPRLYLLDDPDRWIICAALWLKINLNEERATAFLQMLDFLLSEHDCIELSIGTRMVEGVEYGMLSLVNQQPLRCLSSNSPARRPLAAPGGRAFRESRLKNLRKKIAHYQDRTLTRPEQDFRDAFSIGLNGLAAGREELAKTIFGVLQFELSETARGSLAKLLSSEIGCSDTDLQPKTDIH